VPDIVPFTTGRLLHMTVSNFKRIRVVDLHFPLGASVVTISGRNGQGKSSVLDAIAAALGGGSYKPDRPIRAGHKKAEIVLDLDGIIVKRTYTPSGGTVTIEAADGTKYASPQAMLDKLYSNLAFDPLQFTRMTPREQVAELQRITGLTEVFAKIDAERAEALAVKQDSARAVRTLEMTLQGLPDVPGPDAETSVAALAAELTAANETKSKNHKAREWLKQQRAAAADQAADIAELERRLGAVRQALADAEAAIAKHAPIVEEMVDPDIAAITARITSVEQDNAAARRRIARAETLAKLKAARDAEKKAERAVEDISIKREVTLAEATLPVPGLGFTDEGVTLNGVPFNQASSSEQIRTSVEMGFAAGPTLKLMVVREGSLLDDDAMKLLAEIADKYDAQVIVERVTNGGGVGIVIEDGEVASTEEAAQ
jgi:tetratricopeptide (TPR) repeat protein